MLEFRFVALTSLLWACSPAPPGPTTPPDGHANEATTRQSLASREGAVLYKKYCRLCHGPDGEGYAADNANALANQDFLRSASDRFLSTAISRGRPKTAMAGYAKVVGGPLDHGDVRAIIAYLRSFQSLPSIALGSEPVAGDVAAAEPVYAKHCARCHGSRGEGVLALSLNNPMFLASATDGYIRHAIVAGRTGSPMAAYADTLSPVDIDNLTRLIRSWARNVDTTAKTGEVPPSFDHAAVNPKGPAPDFGELREGRYVAAATVFRELEKGAKMVFLDARPTSDWLRSHIPGALPFPYYDGGKMIDSLPKDGTWIISYCACPHAASGKVMDTLRAAGFKNTAVLDEGVLVWTERGYPVTFGVTRPGTPGK